MKNIKYILLAGVFALSACSKLLDIEPTASISDITAISDRSGVESAITGAYNTFHRTGLYFRNQVIVGDLAADNLVFSGTTLDYEQIASHNIPADNSIIDGMWTANYDGINRVNNIIYRLPEISELSQVERDVYMAECLFMRAYFHFNLSTFFGGIPVKIVPTLDLNNINQAKNTIPQVYEQVIQDLLFAEQNLSSSSAVGKANSFAASALLARVYLAQFHLTNDPAIASLAIEKASKVINEGGYQLASNFGDLFGGTENEGIFKIVFDAQNYNRLAQYFFPRSLAGRYEVSPSPSILQGFDSDTIRKDASIAFDAGNLPYANKYRDIISGTDPVFVLRLAEMYMIRAEALAYSNGDKQSIRDDVNMIRTRAGLTAITADDYAALKLSIELENQYEFAFEGHRWFDLVRTKRATQVLDIDVNHTVFPIPLSEFQTNKLMKQNEGY